MSISKVEAQVTPLFRHIDDKLQDLQALLCKLRRTHRADQIDILRRGIALTLTMAATDKPGRKRRG